MATTTLASTAGILMVAAVLAGCNASSQPVADGAPVRFEVTDLGSSRSSPAIAQNGATLEFPALFSINVKAVATDPSRARNLRVGTTAYIPECNGEPVPDSSRTKMIVFPDSVTSPEGSNELVKNLPLSTRTLSDLGLCHDASQPWNPSSVPLTGNLLIRAQVLAADGAWSESDLTIGVGRDHSAGQQGNAAPLPPVASFNGSYRSTIHVTGVNREAKGTHWCDTPGQTVVTVRNGAFDFAVSHPNVPGNPTPVFSATIAQDGSFAGEANNGSISGRLSGSHIEGSIDGEGCSYAFAGDRL